MFITVRIVVDAVALGLSYLLAFLIRFGQVNVKSALAFPLNLYANYLIAIIFVHLAVFYALSMYKTKKGFLLYVDEFVGCVFAVLVAWAILIVATFVRGEYEFSRPIILWALPVSSVLVIIVREIILRVEIITRSRGYGVKKAAIIGSGEQARVLADKINDHPSYGIKYVGTIGHNGPACLGSLDNLEEIIGQHKINIIYLSDPGIDRGKMTELADFCDAHNISFGAIPDVFEILTTTPTVDDVDGFPMIKLKKLRFSTFNRLIKRTLDIVLSLIGIVIFAFPMAIITIIVKITSPGGPAIYQQERVGLGGKIFKLYKFRTMIPDAEVGTGPVLSAEDDPRKTSFGRFLRATNLDELPQLFNILKGEMSFVGPRPERPVFVNEFMNFIPKYIERHKIRPGLAGWAQLHGGYHMPAAEKIKYDLYYIENWSFLLDIKIILKYLQISFTLQRGN